MYKIGRHDEPQHCECDCETENWDIESETHVNW